MLISAINSNSENEWTHCLDELIIFVFNILLSLPPLVIDLSLFELKINLRRVKEKTM